MPSTLGLRRDETGRLDGGPAGIRGAGLLAQRRGGDVEGCKLVDQHPDAGRIRLLVDPVERRHRLSLQQQRDLLVRQHHQLLDQPVRLGLFQSVGPGDVPLRR